MPSAGRGLWSVLSEGMARAPIMGSNPHTNGNTNIPTVVDNNQSFTIYIFQVSYKTNYWASCKVLHIAQDGL